MTALVSWCIPHRLHNQIAPQLVYPPGSAMAVRVPRRAHSRLAAPSMCLWVAHPSSVVSCVHSSAVLMNTGRMPLSIVRQVSGGKSHPQKFRAADKLGTRVDKVGSGCSLLSMALRAHARSIFASLRALFLNLTRYSAEKPFPENPLRCASSKQTLMGIGPYVDSQY